MRQLAILLAATAATLVAAEAKQEQISLLDKDKTTGQNAVQAWWDALPSASNLFSRIEDRIARNIRHSTFYSVLDLVDADDDVDNMDDDNEEPEDHPRPPRRRHGRHGHRGNPDKTIYELIKESNHTTKFAKLVDEHDEIKQLLQDTEHNHTLFVPTDRAFERVPRRRRGHHGGGSGDDNDDDDDDDDHKPPKEFILSLLKYHLAPGLYPLHRIRAGQTLPSELHSPALDGGNSSSSSSITHNHEHDDPSHPQRLRVSTTPFLRLTRLNFYARLLAGDFAAKNGLIHAVDSLLIPPPNSTTILRLLPAQFSTLALALETTGLADELASIPRAGGGTVFAPSNAAWKKLGPRVNGFLFSERGKKYLRALVKYHVVVNETLYSDKYYRGAATGSEGGDDSRDGEEKLVSEGIKGSDIWHVDLASLLGGKPISVVGRRWKGFVSIVVNGVARVVVRDGVANDGVIQVVETVLIPPHRHPGGYGLDDEDELEIPLEELKSRLKPYLETEHSDRRESFGDL